MSTRTVMWGGMAVALAGLGMAAALPWAARPAQAAGLSPGPMGVPICRAAVPRSAVVRVAGAAITTEDQAELLFKLLLLQGHLGIAQALQAAGEARLALPHYGHPVRELYDDIAPELERRGLPGFDGALIRLEALAAGSPGSAAFAAQHEAVQTAVAGLRATVPGALLEDRGFMLGVLSEVAAVATEEYGQALEGGAITKPVEYHDSRGYLMQVDGELKRLEARGAGLAPVRAALADMQAVVPTLLPPARPLAGPAEYKALAARFKQAGAGV